MEILCFATKGSNSNEEARLLRLLSEFDHHVLPFDRSRKRKMFVQILRSIAKDRPRLVVMEGSGLAGGLALLAANRLFGTRFVLSSGDAIGPYLGLVKHGVGWIGRLYERALYRRCAGFIGWTPYLAGRAVTYGANRAMSAANWTRFPNPRRGREATRTDLGIPEATVVFGIVGALNWKERPGYCYGFELVSALELTDRTDIHVLIVGGGSGLDRLRTIAAGDPRVTFTGQVPHEDVLDHMLAIDIASLPQSTDEVGSMRYTTKLSEYVSAGLPVTTGQVPFAYDLDSREGWIVRMPGIGPWDGDYVAATAAHMDSVTAEEVARLRHAVPSYMREFDETDQIARATYFIADLLT